jgi:hypothetical protein
MKLTTIVLALLLVAPAAARAQRLQLDHLDRLAALAGETVNLTIDPAMIKVASGLLGNAGQNDAVAALLNDLEGIYIRSFEFAQENGYAQSDVEEVRKQLAAPGWSRLLEVGGRQEGEQVQIYSWREGNESGGLAIVVAEPKELTVVNIVGKIDLARLGALQGQFGIPELPSVPAPRR